jgi:hypothetical protein
MIRAVLVARQDFPVLFDAMIHYAKAYLTGPRIQRYMTVYQAYESLVEQRDISFSAIRHSLSHPSLKISRPSTVQELKRLFGGNEIDFEIYQHLKQFYIHFGRLIIATDIALRMRIESHLEDLRKSDLYPISYMDPA